MKQGHTIEQLTNELEFQSENKRDFIINTTKLKVGPSLDSNFGEVIFSVPGNKTFRYSMSEHMLGQLSVHAGVPLALVKSMLIGTDKEKQVITKLLTVRLQENESIRMIRTMGRFWDVPYARAFLSDRYKEIDNYSVLNAILPVVRANKDLKIMSASVSETNLYLKIINESSKAEVDVGDVVKAGITISNSEVGAGALRINFLLYRLSCKNGATIAEGSQLRKNHVGRRHRGVGYSWEVKPEDSENVAAFLAQVVEIANDVLGDQKFFQDVVARMKITKFNVIKGDHKAILGAIGKRYGLLVHEQDAILKLLAKEDSMSQFGLINAITKYAGTSKVPSYDRATQLEAVGGSLIDLPVPLWNQFAKLTNPEGVTNESAR